MAWTGKETEKASRAGDTALLLARTVEICSGRRCGTEKDLDLLLRDYSKLQQLTRCICSRLATEAPALVRILYSSAAQRKLFTCICMGSGRVVCIQRMIDVC
jgi:hypothetical protein